MCGLVGVARREPRGVETRMLRRMAAAIQHRGPDGFGVYADDRAGVAHVRLSIIDLAGGAQPMANENGTLLVVYNGEIFNFRELRQELEGHGHRFRTKSDTEVLLHGYEEWGSGLPRHLNGQFAFAIYDRRAGAIFLARDRFGILPLFYAMRDGDLYFASEMKGLLASGEIEAVPDPAGLDQIFTFWAALPPRTPFKGISALEPGTCARWHDGQLAIRRYYQLDFPAGGTEPADALESLDGLMRSSVGMRLVADVPVGGYLSGGLDSSTVCALASEASSEQLRTFSVSFDDPHFDESQFQRTAATNAGSRHAVARISRGDIARIFPDVVRHTETPLLRTAPAPLFLLSQLTKREGIKVVLTGEGADEVFLGYDLFKDTLVRLFCLRQPQSEVRPRLFERLYPNEGSGVRRGDFWARYFLGAGAPEDPLFSHLPRFRLTSWIKDFYSVDFRASLHGFDALTGLRDDLPKGFSGWSPLGRAAYLEMTTLLSPYLLASQGDRMSMAHGVESRVPFLDHRLFEFAAALPERSKLRGLREKDILRRWAPRVLPASVADRPKQAYRAPDIPAFFGSRPPEYATELLQPESLDRTGIFDSRAVTGLLRRCRSGSATGTRESQALVGILSTQLWYHQFIKSREPASAVRTPALTSLLQSGSSHE